MTWINDRDSIKQLFSRIEESFLYLSIFKSNLN